MLQPGQIILNGKYRVGKRLGSGGMGEVYEATDLVLHRNVALKAVPGRPDDSGRLRVTPDRLREARNAVQLAHINIVKVHDADTENLDGQNEFLIIDMELVNGQTLGSWLTGEGRQCLATVSDALQLGQQVLEGIAHAHLHKSQVVHRDLKPSNIMLQDQGESHPRWRAVITDFGLSVSLRSSHFEPESGPGGGRSLYGSALYMPPEHLSLWARRERRRPTFEEDVHALGVILWQILAGSCARHPLYAETDRIISWSELTDEDLPAVLRCVKNKELRYSPLTETDIPEPFLRVSCNEIIRWALGFSGSRPSTALVLRDAFTRIQEEFARQQRDLREVTAHRQGQAYAMQQAQRQIAEFRGACESQRAAERRRSQRMLALVVAGATLAVGLSAGGVSFQMQRMERERLLDKVRSEVAWAPACGQEEALALLDLSDTGEPMGGPTWAALIPVQTPEQVRIVECGKLQTLYRLGRSQLSTHRAASPERLLVRLSPTRSSVLVIDGTFSQGAYARVLSTTTLLAEAGAVPWSVKEASFSSGGEALLRATNSTDPTVLLSGPSHAYIRHLEEDLPGITAALQSPDGELVVAGNSKGKVALWRRQPSGEFALLTREPLSLPASDDIKLLALSPDKRWLAVSFTGVGFWIYELAGPAGASRSELNPRLKYQGSLARGDQKESPGPRTRVAAVGFAAEGMLLVGGNDQMVRGFSLGGPELVERWALRLPLTPKRLAHRDNLLIVADEARLSIASTDPKYPSSLLDLVAQDVRWLQPHSGGFMLFAKRADSLVYRFVLLSPQHLAGLTHSVTEARRELADVLLPRRAEPPRHWVRSLSLCTAGSEPSIWHRLTAPVCALLRPEELATADRASSSLQRF